MASQISILRELDTEEIARHRSAGEFFWADLDLESTTADEIAATFGLDKGATDAVVSFRRDVSPSRKFHVDADLIVFRFWCAARPDAGPLGGIEAIEPFEVNVVLHGDYLLTVHEHRHDVPGDTTEGHIPPGRSERYAVYTALDGMANNVLEALSSTERAVGELESRLLLARRPHRRDKELIASLRDRLTGLRMRLGPQQGIFERVSAEIDHIEGLEGAHGEYFDRIEAQLDRTVDRIDAASQALSHALEIQLNETSYQLTIVATIFLPLTFIVGFFGMNFGWMVRGINSEADFLIWGIAIWAVPLGLAIAYLVARNAARRARPD